MEITTTETKRAALVKVAGRVDSSTAPELDKTLQGLIDKKQYNIVIDLADCTYMSSAGLRALISALKTTRRIEHRGDVRLAAVNPRIKGVLELAGLTELFKIYDDDVSAIGSF